MEYDNIYLAKKDFRNYNDFSDNLELFPPSEQIDNFEFGDFILFQHIADRKISRPILGIFLGFTVWDMAIVLNFVEVLRAYCYSNKYLITYNEKLGLSEPIAHRDPVVENIAMWNENINLLGHYKRKPTITELRNSLTNNIL